MTPTVPPDADIEALLAAAGLLVPADLKPGVLSEARDLRRMASLLRGPRGAAAEPFTVIGPVDAQ